MFLCKYRGSDQGNQRRKDKINIMKEVMQGDTISTNYLQYVLQILLENLVGKIMEWTSMKSIEIM